jgi:hypothetical protein
VAFESMDVDVTMTVLVIVFATGVIVEDRVIV